MKGHASEGPRPSASRPLGSAAPGVTIVIPTRDRLQRLEACLDAVTALDYPAERVQVVVVDDGGRESARPVVDQYGGRLDVQLVEQDAAGPAAARNTGVARARHDHVAFTDDDCTPDPGWLRALASRFDVFPGAMLGGRTVNALEANPFSEASQVLVSYLYDYYNSPERGARFLTSNNMAMPTELFLEVGGFHASFPRAAAEDRDFCDRWRAAGHAMRYVPEAVVRHSHAMDWIRFCRQHFGYGRGAHVYHRRRLARGETRVRLEPLRFYTGLLAYPLRNGAGLRTPLLSGLLALAQAANMLGFLTEALLDSRGSRVERQG